jgi:hypothetical protein
MLPGILHWMLKIRVCAYEKEHGHEWNELAVDRDNWRAVVNMAMKFRIPQNAGNFLCSLETVSLSRRTLLLVVSLFVGGNVTVRCEVLAVVLL